MHSVLVKDTLFPSLYKGHLQDLVVLFDLLQIHIHALNLLVVRCLEAAFTMCRREMKDDVGIQH